MKQAVEEHRAGELVRWNPSFAEGEISLDRSANDPLSLAKLIFGTYQHHPTALDLTETFAFLELLQRLDIPLVNSTAGRSAGGRGAADRRRARAEGPFPGADLRAVGVPLYLQEWLPAVAAEVVRHGDADSVGLGRMMGVRTLSTSSC